MKATLTLVLGFFWICFRVHGQEMKWTEPCTENPGSIFARIVGRQDMDTLMNKQEHNIRYYWQLTNNGKKNGRVQYYIKNDYGWRLDYVYLKPNQTLVMPAFYTFSSVDVSSTNMWIKMCWMPADGQITSDQTSIAVTQPEQTINYEQIKSFIISKFSTNASPANGRVVSQERTKWSNGDEVIKNYSYSNFNLADYALSYKEENGNGAIAHTKNIQINLCDIISIDSIDKRIENDGDATTNYPEGIQIKTSTASIKIQDHTKSKHIDKIYDRFSNDVVVYGSFITESNIGNTLFNKFKTICPNEK